MVKIYFNITEEEINEKIRDELKIFPNDIDIFRSKVKIPQHDFIFKACMSFYKLIPENYEMIKYNAFHLGETMYEFYNVISKK